MTTRREFIRNTTLGSVALALGASSQSNLLAMDEVSPNVLGRRLQFLWTSEEGRVVRHSHDVFETLIHYGENQFVAPLLRVKVYPGITLNEVCEFNRRTDARFAPMRLDKSNKSKIFRT